MSSNMRYTRPPSDQWGSPEDVGANGNGTHMAVADATHGQLRNPHDVGAANRMAVFVHNERLVGCPENSVKMYEPKIMEFEQIYEHVYPDSPYKYNIDADKFYRFLFYTSFREQKKGGGKIA
jgi:hypothetical protein